MARFYLDEDIDPEVGSILERYTHDVVHAYDLGNRSVPDPQHLLVAAEAQRILVTFNRRDFQTLHQFWTALNIWGNLDRRHAGILTAWGQINAEPWADLLHAFANWAPELGNEMWGWNIQQQDWFPFGW